jgi:hypothetical protein
MAVIRLLVAIAASSMQASQKTANATDSKVIGMPTLALGEAEIDAEIGGAFDDADAGKAADQQQICTHPVKATG